MISQAAEQVSHESQRPSRPCGRSSHGLEPKRHEPWSKLLMAVSTRLEGFLWWVSLEEESDYVGSILGALIFSNSLLRSPQPTEKPIGFPGGRRA